jgi:hypothetical protein
MTRVVRALAIALSALGWLAPPVAVVWLALLGEWWALGAALVALVAPVVLSVLLLPGLGLAAVAARITAGPRDAPRRLLTLVVALAALVYAAALITAWCMGAFTFLMSRASADTWIPLLLLSYAVGTGPWKALARRELRAGRRGDVIQTLFLQFAALLVMIVYAAARPASLASLWWVFAGVMAVEVVAYAILAPGQGGGAEPVAAGAAPGSP